MVIPDLGDPKPYPSENLGKIIKFIPVKDQDIITFMWVLPYYERSHQTQPLLYFTHLFGHEGQNSLLSYLISEGLARELMCSP